MKKSELKEFIKAAYLAETNSQDDDASPAIASDYDPLAEADEVKEGTWSVLPERIPEFIQALEDVKEEYHAVVGSDEVYDALDQAIMAAEKLMGEETEEIFPGTLDALDDLKIREADEEADEADEVEVEDDEVDVEVGAEEEPEKDTFVVDKQIISLSSLPSETRDILKTLQTLRTQAEEFGDQKFVTQVGNTITFFTRDFVVAGDEPTKAKVDESLEMLRMKKLAGLLTEGEYSKALLKEEAVLKEDANTDLELKSVAKQIFSVLKKYGLKPSYEADGRGFQSKEPADGYGGRVHISDDAIMTVAVYNRGVWDTLKKQTNELDMGPQSYPSDEEKKQINQIVNKIYKDIISTLGQDKFEIRSNPKPNEYGDYILQIKKKGGQVNPN